MSTMARPSRPNASASSYLPKRPVNTTPTMTAADAVASESPWWTLSSTAVRASSASRFSSVNSAGSSRIASRSESATIPGSSARGSSTSASIAAPERSPVRSRMACQTASYFPVISSQAGCSGRLRP